MLWSLAVTAVCFGTVWFKPILLCWGQFEQHSISKHLKSWLICDYHVMCMQSVNIGVFWNGCIYFAKFCVVVILMQFAKKTQPCQTLKCNINENLWKIKLREINFFVILLNFTVKKGLDFWISITICITRLFAAQKKSVRNPFTFTRVWEAGIWRQLKLYVCAANFEHKNMWVNLTPNTIEITREIDKNY